MLQQATEAVFAPFGPLARADMRYQPREGQLRMAQAVAGQLEQGGVLVVEAGTGVGKTYAYLVPLLLSGERALISTATKALQDQLFARDLPQLLDLLALPRRLALLKGRSSYLCWHRLERARSANVGMLGGLERALAKVELWAQATTAGDLAELPGLDEQSPLIPMVTSTRENCLGSRCDRFRDCHVHRARSEALAADIVVINHHLFFADWAVRESGAAELLPTVRAVVFDEAHQLNEIGVQFLGMQLSAHQVESFARDLLEAGLTHARGLADWRGWASALEQAAAVWRALGGLGLDGSRLRWGGDAPEGAEPEAWHAALRAVGTACAQAVLGLDGVMGMSPDLDRLAERGNQMLARLARFAEAVPPGRVRWAEMGRAARLHESPLYIGETMRSQVLPVPSTVTQEDGWPAPSTGPGRAWVFTSATLGDDEQLRWFTEPCGLDGVAQVLRVPSPFDYERQAAVYVPPDLPQPAEPGHSAALARWLVPVAQRLQGRTLMLTTTLRALRVLGQALREALPQLDVLIQGEGSKKALLERFREGQSQGIRGCVLVASASFWEGVNVPGEALQLVVIDKLPFPPPDDPLVEARVRALQAQGGKPFVHYALPEAAVALKQGAGRLIRHETDQGLLVIGDVRLRTRGYGKRLLAALPPMRRLETAQDWNQALEAMVTITRTSTMDHPWP